MSVKRLTFPWWRGLLYIMSSKISIQMCLFITLQLCKMYSSIQIIFWHNFWKQQWKQLLLWSFVIVISLHLLFSISKLSLELTEKDLQCFNDYETQMKCSFGTDGLKSCSEYKLNITRSLAYSWVFVQVIYIYKKSHFCSFSNKLTRLTLVLQVTRIYMRLWESSQWQMWM